MPEQQSLLELSREELETWLGAADHPSYRTEQVLAWIYQRHATDFSTMTDLPLELRRQLGSAFSIGAARETGRSQAPDGTVKLLLRWPDGASAETVMIPSDSGTRPRRTVCISTQVGCAVGCRFCASGLDGVLRNLTVGEVLEQVLTLQRLLLSRGERLSHVVFMGMGEPLANYETTVESVRRLNAGWGLGLAQRRITVSTVGLPQQIERLAREQPQCTLALSLHAPNDALRKDLIPWARNIPLESLLAACHFYFEQTGREVTLEYCLLADVNDSPVHADQLSRIARDLRAHVNLLMYNPVKGLPFSRPSRNQAISFLKRLRSLGVRAHLRESRGLETDAACGQLRRTRSSANR